MGTPSRYYSTKAIELRLYAVDSSTSGNLPASDSVGTTHQIEIRDPDNGTTNFNLPTTFPFTLIIDPDQSTEEVITATAVIGNTYTITRGSDNSNIALHNIGAVIKHGVSARDYADSRVHEAATSNIHGLGSGSSFVGTTDTQTLTNKTLTAPTFTGTTTASTINVTTDLQFNAVSLTSAWTAWTAGTSGIANSTVTSRYTQIGKTVHFQYYVAFSGANTGGTTLTFNLPVTAKADNIVAPVRMVSGAANFVGVASSTSTSAMVVNVIGTAATYANLAGITATVPNTWQSGDYIRVTGTYEAA
jgi:hypothetical protein